MPTIDLAVKNYAAPTLAEDLAKQVAEELAASARPDDPMPVESVDAIETLAAQAAAIAAAQKLTGAGHVEIVRTEAGWQVQLFTADDQHAHAQALDPAAMAGKVAARKAKADAAAKAAARQKAARVAPLSPSRKTAGTLAAPAAAKAPPASPISPAARPTTPPPRRP
jgi:hypothetical protein